jgi:hypothetical protein
MTAFEINSLIAAYLHGAAILITGLIAFLLFRKDKNDKVENAAKVLIEEIRQADSAIDFVKATWAVHQLLFILPNSSWAGSKYLFVNKLDQDDFNAISNYYSACSIAERLLNELKNVNPHAMEEKGGHVQKELISIAVKHINDTDATAYKEEVKKFTTIIDNESSVFQPGYALDWLKSIVPQIPKFTGTSTFDKLKKLAKI